MKRTFTLGLALLGAVSAGCGSDPPRVDTPQTLPPAEPQADLSREPTTTDGTPAPEQKKPEQR
jgi:hypothetical protein